MIISTKITEEAKVIPGPKATFKEESKNDLPSTSSLGNILAELAIIEDLLSKVMKSAEYQHM